MPPSWRNSSAPSASRIWRARKSKAPIPLIHLIGAGQSLDADLTLVCPAGAGDPRLQNAKTRRTFAISDPQLRAVAEKACGAGPLGAGNSQSVNVVNQTGRTLFVGFSGAPITWEGGCTHTTTGVQIKTGHSCGAKVQATNSPTRFCASPYAPPNCVQAQDNHQTLVEPTFDTAAQCSWTGVSGPCVA